MTASSTDRGATVVEFAVFVPIFIIIFVAAFDLGRLVYTYQIVTGVAREAANLVSRGATEMEAIAASEAADGMLDLGGETGGIIISRIQRRDVADGTPWVFTQTSSGGLPGLASRVGTENGPAAVPSVEELPPGITLYAVEVEHEFVPVLDGTAVGLQFYPATAYDVAFF